MEIFPQNKTKKVSCTQTQKKSKLDLIMINFTVFSIKSKLWIWSTLWAEFVKVKSPQASKVLLLTFHYHQNEMEA